MQSSSENERELQKEHYTTQTDVKDAESIQSKIEDSTGSTTSRKRGIDESEDIPYAIARKVVRSPRTESSYHPPGYFELTVSPGSLGLTIRCEKGKHGAIIQKLNPECTFK